MLSIGTGVGKGIKIDGLYNTVFVRTHTDMDLHLMTRRRCDHGFLSGKNDLGRTSGNPGYQCRKNLTDRGLFCTKAPSDTRLDHTDFGIFSAFPTILRIWNGICVEETTVSL